MASQLTSISSQVVFIIFISSVIECTKMHRFEQCTRPQVEQTVISFNKHVTQCMLKLREKHILTSFVQQDIISEMNLIVTEVHDTYRGVFESFCKENELSSDQLGIGEL